MSEEKKVSPSPSSGEPAPLSATWRPEPNTVRVANSRDAGDSADRAGSLRSRASIARPPDPPPPKGK